MQFGVELFAVNFQLINKISTKLKIKLCPLPVAVAGFRFASVCLHEHHREHRFREGVGVRGPDLPPNENSFISIVKLPKIQLGPQCSYRHVNAQTHCASMLGNIIWEVNI